LSQWLLEEAPGIPPGHGPQRLGKVLRMEGRIGTVATWVEYTVVRNAVSSGQFEKFRGCGFLSFSIL